MPKFEFKSKKIKTINAVAELNPPVKDCTNETTAASSINHIAAMYNINKPIHLNKNTTHYSKFFKSLMVYIDFDVKSYNILNKYNPDIKANEYFICFYKDVVDKAVKISRHYKGCYKIYDKIFCKLYKDDVNVDLVIVESNDNPAYIIFKIV